MFLKNEYSILVYKILLVLGIILFPLFIFMTYACFMLYVLNDAPFLSGAEPNYMIFLYEIVLFFLGLVMPFKCWRKIRQHKIFKDR